MSSNPFSRFLQSLFGTRAGGAPTSRVPGAARGFPRVLCVDDDEAVLKTIQRQLADQYDTVAVHSAAEARTALAEQGPFDVILCDLRMPGTSGLTFLHQAYEIAPSTERIILTGHVDPTTMAVARAAGHAIQLLTKPCSTSVLRQAIADAVGRRRAALAT